MVVPMMKQTIIFNLVRYRYSFFILLYAFPGIIGMQQKVAKGDFEKGQYFESLLFEITISWVQIMRFLTCRIPGNLKGAYHHLPCIGIITTKVVIIHDRRL